MKSKLVKYPFNDGKRYRWDTYKMGKQFQYYWDKTPDAQFSTITPYIKTEPFDASTAFTDEYALLNEHEALPSVELSNPTIRFCDYESEIFEPWDKETYKYVKSTYGSNIKLEISEVYPPEEIDFPIVVITRSNYNSKYKLSRQEYEWILENTPDANGLLALLLNRNPSQFGTINMATTESGTIYGDWDSAYLYHTLSTPSISIKMEKDVSIGKITLIANNGIFTYGAGPNDPSAAQNKTKIIFPERQDLIYGGGNHFHLENVADTITDYQNNNFLAKCLFDIAITNYPSGKSVFYPNTPGYNVGYFICHHFYGFSPLLPPERFNTPVYYVSGKVFTPNWYYGTFGNENTKSDTPIFPVHFHSNAQCVLVGYANFPTAGATTEDNIIEWQSPDEYHWEWYDAVFSWLNDDIKQQYQNALYGIEADGTYQDVIAIKNEFQKVYPYTFGESQEPYYSLVPTDMVIPNVTDEIKAVWQYYSQLQAINPITLDDMKYVIKKSDWPSTMTNVFDIPPYYLNNATHILKPDVKLLGDTNSQIVNVAENTIYHYKPGEYNNGVFAEKPLLVNAPCEYDENGNVISNTWLTYNSYTPEQ